MKTHNLKISQYFLSKIFWEIIFTNGTLVIDTFKNEILKENDYFESLRKAADYNTGSIAFSASVCLALLAHYFKPRIVCEVGTFIGRSTFSIALGAQIDKNSSSNIYTCDYSNNIKLDFSNHKFSISQYPLKSSTEMLNNLFQNNIIPDIYLLDGRVQPEDLKILESLKANEALIILDDFEGYEKGVVNSFALTQFFKNNFRVIYPPSEAFLKEHGLNDICTTALLIPIQSIEFVNQA